MWDGSWKLVISRKVGAMDTIASDSFCASCRMPRNEIEVSKGLNRVQGRSRRASRSGSHVGHESEGEDQDPRVCNFSFLPSHGTDYVGTVDVHVL